MQWLFGTRIRKVDGDFVVTVRDLAEVATSGSTREEALELAADAINVAVAGRIEDEMDLSPPSPLKRGEVGILVDAHLAAKASVYLLWKRAGISKVELARRLGRRETEARRILDPRFGTRLDQLQRAADTLGGQLVVSVIYK